MSWWRTWNFITICGNILLQTFENGADFRSLDGEAQKYSWLIKHVVRTEGVAISGETSSTCVPVVLSSYHQQV